MNDPSPRSGSAPAQPAAATAAPDATTTLYLVRHGATERTEEDRFSGDVDIPLSEQGKRQAAQLAARLAADRFGAVYASPLLRATQTARILADVCGLPVEARDGLREIRHGHWEGQTRQAVESGYPEEYSAWEADPFTFAPEGGESGVAVLARALPVIREIVTRHAGQRVIVVSHKATIRLVLSSLLGIDARGYRDRLDQAPACLNVLSFHGPVRARLMLFNDVSHYADQPRVSVPHLSRWWGTG